MVTGAVVDSYWVSFWLLMTGVDMGQSFPREYISS